MTAGLEQAAHDDGGPFERAPLQAALAASVWSRLHLQPRLEAAYHARRRTLAIANIRANWLPVMLAIALIAAVTFAAGLVDDSMYSVVVFGYCVVLFAVGVVAAGAMNRAWNVHIDKLLIFAAFISLGGMHLGTVVAVEGSALRSIAEYGVIFITIAVCTISGISPTQSLLTVVAAMLLFLAGSAFTTMFPGALAGLGLPRSFASVLDGFAPDWSRFPFYAIGSAIIAGLMGLSHVIRDRTVFLQGQLLVLEKRELDQLTGELTLMSRQDALTGLANRRHFDEVFAREWAACQREGTSMNLLFIDVDFFKRFNDHYGHQAGDECLAKVGGALASQAKRGADFVARYGGEEFVAFFPRTNSGGLIAIAQRMIDAVDDLAIEHLPSDAARHVTISVGLATLTPATGQTQEKLIQAADAALYRAKQAGRHCCVAAWEP